MPSLGLQGAFTSGELSPSLSARVDLSKYQQGCRTLRNFVVQPHGGATKRPGFVLLDSMPGEAVLLSFVFNTEQAYCLCFGEKWLRVATRDGFVLKNGAPYTLDSPYTLAEARKMCVTQSADVLFIACRGHVPRKLMRLAHDEWQFEAMSFDPPLPTPGKPTLTFVNEAKKSDGSGSSAQLVTPYTYYVTAVDKDGKESELSEGADLTGPASNNWQAGDYLSVAWQAVPGAEEYRLYKSSFGSRPGYITVISDLTYNDYNVAASLTEGAPKYDNPFPDGDYPGTVCLFEQRLVFASSSKRPQTIWMSKSGDYGNFAIYDPVTDDSPIELTLASSEVSPMCWMVALRSLILGSSSVEWELGATGDGAFTAKTAKATPQSYRGSKELRALIIGNVLLHVSRSGSQVRDLQYDFGSDSYGGTDRTILAAHLLESERIEDWTYQQSPDSIVWAVRSDGVLLGMTFQAEHEVTAWHRHDTDGLFKAVCAVPQGYDDTLFAVVLREGKHYLERMADRYLGGDASRAVFVDCALTYEGAPVKALSGLDHLEGKEIGIYSNGAVEPPQVVERGAVSLLKPSGLVTVGLPYVADLETMPVELIGQDGASVGRKKYINAVNVLFRDTVTAKVGVGFGHLGNVKWRSRERYGEPLRPFSGIKSVTTRSLAENVVTVCIRSDEPTPMTILALMPSVEVK